MSTEDGDKGLSKRDKMKHDKNPSVGSVQAAFFLLRQRFSDSETLAFLNLKVEENGRMLCNT